MNTLKGKFIIFEGIDKAGKDTQAELLVESLKKPGYEVFLTHEPIENNIWGKIIRFVLKHRIHLPPMLFQRMYYWNRLPHAKEIIRHQNAGEVVVCVRYWFSTVAYAYLSISEKAGEVIKWHQYMPKPDLVFYLDLSPAKAIERLRISGSNTDFFEKEEKLKKIREGYWFCWNNISYMEQLGFVRLNADQPPEEVSRRIQGLITEWKE